MAGDAEIDRIKKKSEQKLYEKLCRLACVSNSTGVSEKLKDKRLITMKMSQSIRADD